MSITLQDQKNKCRSLALVKRSNTSIHSSYQKNGPFKLCWSDETLSKNIWIAHESDWINALKTELKKITPFFIKDLQEQVELDRKRKPVEVELWTVKNEEAVKVKKIFMVDEAHESVIKESFKKFQDNKDFERWKDCDEEHFIQWIPVLMKRLFWGNLEDMFRKMSSESNDPDLKEILNDIASKKSWEEWGNIVKVRSDRHGDYCYWRYGKTGWNSTNAMTLNSYALNEVWLIQRENELGLVMPLLKSMVIKSKGKQKIRKEDWFNCLERWADHPSELEDLIDQQMEEVCKDYFIPEGVQSQLNFEEKNSRWYLNSEKGWASLYIDKGVFKLEWTPLFDKAHLFINNADVQRAYTMLEKADTYTVLEVKNEVVQSSPINNTIEMSPEGRRFESYRLMKTFSEVVQKETQELTKTANEVQEEKVGLKEVKKKSMRL